MRVKNVYSVWASTTLSDTMNIPIHVIFTTKSGKEKSLFIDRDAAQALYNVLGEGLSLDGGGPVFEELV